MSAITMLSAFVNTNKPNVNIETYVPEALDDETQFTKLPQVFAVQFCYDEVETEACYPVYLYALRGKLVAWYDCENFCGYSREVALPNAA